MSFEQSDFYFYTILLTKYDIIQMTKLHGQLFKVLCGRVSEHVHVRFEGPVLVQLCYQLWLYLAPEPMDVKESFVNISEIKLHQ